MAAANGTDVVAKVLCEFSDAYASTMTFPFETGKFYGEEHVRQIAKFQKDKILQKYADVIPYDRVTEIRREMKKIIDNGVKRNKESESEAKTFLDYQLRMMCQNFKRSMSAQVLLRLDMRTSLAEEIVNTVKVSSISYFRNLWSGTHGDLYEECMEKLKNELDRLGKETLANRSPYLPMFEHSLEVLQHIRMTANVVPIEVRCERGIEAYRRMTEVMNDLREDLRYRVKVVLNECGNPKNVACDEFEKWAENLYLRMEILCRETTVF